MSACSYGVTLLESRWHHTFTLSNTYYNDNMYQLLSRIENSWPLATLRLPNRIKMIIDLYCYSKISAYATRWQFVGNRCMMSQVGNNAQTIMVNQNNSVNAKLAGESVLYVFVTWEHVDASYVVECWHIWKKLLLQLETFSTGSKIKTLGFSVVFTL